MTKRYFIQNTINGYVNHSNAFSTEESAIEYVNKVHGLTELVETTKVIEKDLGVFICDIANGQLLKAYFENEDEAKAFLFRTYDIVRYIEDYDYYEIFHAGIRFGAFEILS